MLRSRLFPLGLLLALCAAPIDADAFVRVAGDDRAYLRALTLVAGTDGDRTTYTASARVDVRGRKIVVLIPVDAPAEALAPRLADDAALDDLRAATGPQLEERQSVDPCVDLENLYGGTPRITLADRPERVARGEASVSVLGPDQDLEAWAKAQKVKLDEATKAALRPHLAADKPVLALTFSPKKSGRGLRLPAIQWTGRPAPLDLDLAADQTSPGQVLTVHLVLADVAGTATPDAPVVDLGTGISLPEVVFEAPRDLFRAAVAHALRREARPALLRVHADVAARIAAPTRDALALPGRATVTRYAARLGRGEERPEVTFTAKALPFPYVTTWVFRRPWRAPVRCEIAPRYQSIVRVQQRSELMAMSALTGRRVDDVAAESTRRGYLQKKDGSLGKVKVRRPD